MFFVLTGGILVLPSGASAAIYVSGEISEPTVWTASASPYVVGHTTVVAGASLIIESGTIVKFQHDPLDGITLDVFGSLYVNGVSGQPVIFTSINDDVYGGDTDGDGGTHLPQAGDWNAVSFNAGSSGSVRGANFRYGSVAGYWQPWSRIRPRDGAVDGYPLSISPLSSATFSSQPSANPLTPDTWLVNATKKTAGNATQTMYFWSDVVGPSFYCSIDDGAWEPCASPRRVVTPADGRHVFSVYAVDSLGRADATPVSSAWNVDAVAPVVVPVRPPNGSDAVITVTGTVDDSTAIVTVDGRKCLTEGTNWICKGVPLAMGENWLIVVAKDSSGNEHSQPISVTRLGLNARLKVGVVLYEPHGMAHVTSSVPPPCKQVKLRTAAYAGHGKKYFEDMMRCVNDYFRENSYGNLQFDLATVAGWQEAKLESHDLAYYVKHSISRLFHEEAVFAAGLDYEDYDVVIAVHPGQSMQKSDSSDNLATEAWPRTVTVGEKSVTVAAINVAENDPVGSWVHELTHAAGISMKIPFGVPDEILQDPKFADVNFDWSLMSWGNNNGGNYDRSYRGDGSDPAPITSYDRLLFGWLEPDVHCRGERGVFAASTLETSAFGDSVVRYNLADLSLGDACRDVAQTQYYLLEGRRREMPGRSWSKSWPAEFDDEAVVVYRVNEDVKRNTTALSRVTVKQSINRYNPGYLDAADMLQFTFVQPESEWTGKSYVKIEPATASLFDRRYLGAVVTPRSSEGASVGSTIAGLPPQVASYMRWEARQNRSFSTFAVFVYLSAALWFLLRRGLSAKRGAQAPGRARAVLALAFVVYVIVLWLDWGIGSAARPTYLWAVATGYQIKAPIAVALLAAVPMFFLAVFPWSITLLGFDGLFCTARKRWRAALGILGMTAFAGLVANEIARSGAELAYYFYWPWLKAAALFIPFSAVAMGTAFALAVSFVPARFLGAGTESLLRKTLTVMRFAAVATFLVVVLCHAFVLRYYRQADLASRSVSGASAYQDELAMSLSAAPMPHLEVFCDDGRRVAIDPATGSFVNDFPEAIVSGDGHGDPEWIYLPASVSGCHYTISSRETADWLAVHPDVALRLSGEANTYELYAREIDPASGIFTSATVAGAIAPGQGIEYEITGSGEGIGVSQDTDTSL